MLVARGSAYRAYPSSFSPTDKGVFPLDQTCRYTQQRRQV